MKMDTSMWKEFRIGDLFIQERGKESAPNQNDDGLVPLIKETSMNNGFDRNVQATQVFDGNCITVSVNYASVVFYQAKPFCASVNILILRNDVLNEYSGLFIASILSEMHSRVFDYIYKISKDRLNDEIIKLPATPDGQPDWNYMEQYMRSVMENCEKKYQTLVCISQDNHQVDTTLWGEFRVGDLFDISPTKNYGLSNTELFESEGGIPVIVNSSMNNGVGAYVGLEPTEEGNVITFSDTTDANSIFYQRDPFVGYSHVQAMRPLKKNKWKEESMLFFLSCFRGQALSMNFDYANKFRRDIAVNISVKLPITSSGEPDWDYMEQYMKRIMQRQNDVVNALRKIV